MRALIRQQAGVLSSKQGRDHDWSGEAFRAQVHAGRWQRVVRGVYVTHTGALTYEQRIFAALLCCGDDAVTSHQTALWLADPIDEPPRLVHLLIPAVRTVQMTLKDVIVHRSRRLPASDIHPARSPARVTVERAVLDCARIARTDDEAVTVIARTVQRGLTTPARLHAAITSTETLPRRALLLDALALASVGAHSAAEVRYHRGARAHGLPMGTAQVRIVLGGARYLDVRYDKHPGRAIVLELDGRLAHFDAAIWRRDMLRDSIQIAMGDVVLRAPALLVFTDVALPIGLVATALRREGWTGQLRRCRSRACGCQKWPGAIPRPWDVWT